MRKFLKLTILLFVCFLSKSVLFAIPNVTLQPAPDVPGGAKFISVGGANGDVVWAVGNQRSGDGNAIFRLIGNTWQPQPGWAGGNISVGADGTAWVIGGLNQQRNNNNIHRWIGGWVPTLGGTATQILAISSREAYVIGMDNGVWWTVDAGVKWQRLPASASNDTFKLVGATNSGGTTVWAVGKGGARENKLYRWNGSVWVEDINYASGVMVALQNRSTVIHVNSGNDAYVSSAVNPDGKLTAWAALASGTKFKDISVSANGKVWAIKTDGKLYSGSISVPEAPVVVVPTAKVVVAPAAPVVVAPAAPVVVVPAVNFTELAKLGFVDGAKIAFKTSTGKYLKLEKGFRGTGAAKIDVDVLRATGDSIADVNCQFIVEKRGDYVGFKSASGDNLMFGFGTAYFAKIAPADLNGNFTLVGNTKDAAATTLSNVTLRWLNRSWGDLYLAQGFHYGDARFLETSTFAEPTAKLNIEIVHAVVALPVLPPLQLTPLPNEEPGMVTYIHYPEKVGDNVKFAEAWKAQTPAQFDLVFSAKGQEGLRVRFAAVKSMGANAKCYEVLIGYDGNTKSAIRKLELPNKVLLETVLDAAGGVDNPEGRLSGGIGAEDNKEPYTYWIRVDFKNKIISWGKGGIPGMDEFQRLEDKAFLEFVKYFGLGGTTKSRMNYEGIKIFKISEAAAKVGDTSIFMPSNLFEKEGTQLKVVTAVHVVNGKTRKFGITTSGKLVALVPGSMGKWAEQTIKNENGDTINEALESLALGEDGLLVVVTSKGRVFKYAMIAPVLPPVVPTSATQVSNVPMQSGPSVQTFAIPIPAGATQSEIDALIKQHTGSAAQTVSTTAVAPVAVVQQPVQTQIVPTTTTKVEQPVVAKVEEVKAEPVKEEKPAKGGKKGGKVVTAVKEKLAAAKTPAAKTPAAKTPAKTPAKGGGMSAKTTKPAGKSKK